ncbi:MAG: extracellular solute-binding protein [Chitinivibrionales bacterium]|nr:extracellular solute-binding protein [Chitinivibrionales bacterium]
MLRKWIRAWIFLLSVTIGMHAADNTVTVLIHMIPEQEAFFRNEVIPEFARRYRTKVEVISVRALDQLPVELNNRKGAVSLVKVPFDQMWPLVADGLIRPLNSFLTVEEIEEYEKDYALTWFAKKEGVYYYVPRKYETRIMVYRKSKVADALRNFKKFVKPLQGRLKELNGYGLPRGYALENNPDKWDYYDIFVLGWIWAHTPYDSVAMPRIVHRGKRYSGTTQRLIDRVFQLNGTQNSFFNMVDHPVIDTYFWEALYAYCKIYNPRMWENAYDGKKIWQAFADNTAFLSFMTQIDCFFLHGSRKHNIEGYLQDTEDMGIATMPQGCSFELYSDGACRRKGRKSITTGGWWWGIADGAHQPRLAYELARFITSKKVQVDECVRFGMIPVRQDVINKHSVLFPDSWISPIFYTSYMQLKQNGNNVVPYSKNYDKIAKCYLDAWFDIVVNKQWNLRGRPPSRTFIHSHLSQHYMPRIYKLIDKPPQ